MSKILCEDCQEEGRVEGCLKCEPSADPAAAPSVRTCVRAYVHDCQCETCRAKPAHDTRGWQPS